MSINLLAVNDKILISDITSRSIEYLIKQYNEKFPKAEFLGDYPIRVLHYNVLESYNHFSEEIELYLQDKELRLHPEIKYLINEYKSPELHYLSDGMHQMIISEPFCSYLWCLAYFFLIHFEYVAQKKSPDTIADEYVITDIMLERAAELLSWGINLKDELTGWDYLSTPSPFPTPSLVGSEILFCYKANNIYKHAVLACLYHELGHAVTLPNFPTHMTSEKSKEYETEADNFMFNTMFKELEKSNPFGISLGITIAYFSILFITDPKKIVSSSHPDVDSRIYNMLETFKSYCESLDSELGEHLLSSVYFMNIYCFQVYFQMYNIDPQKDGSQHREFDFPGDALKYFFDVLDEFK